MLPNMKVFMEKKKKRIVGGEVFIYMLVDILFLDYLMVYQNKSLYE